MKKTLILLVAAAIAVAGDTGSNKNIDLMEPMAEAEQELDEKSDDLDENEPRYLCGMMYYYAVIATQEERDKISREAMLQEGVIDFEGPGILIPYK